MALPRLLHGVGRDIGVIREYAQAANDLGYDYLLAYDHVLGANRASRPDWRPAAYNSSSMFHEPFTLLAWLAEVAPKLELVTGVIVLPQRQTDESIPIWVGGLSDAAIERVGRLGDGWLPLGEPDAENAERIERFRQIAAEGGRDVDAIGIDAPLSYARTSPDHWGDIIDGWRTLGATHLSVDTMSAGFRGAEHIEGIRKFREATG